LEAKRGEITKKYFHPGGLKGKRAGSSRAFTIFFKSLRFFREEKKKKKKPRAEGERWLL